MHAKAVSLCGEQPRIDVTRRRPAGRKARRQLGSGVAAEFGGHERRHTRSSTNVTRLTDVLALDSSGLLTAAMNDFPTSCQRACARRVCAQALRYCTAAWCHHGTARRPDKKELGLPTA
jgi:hypothetical protein